MFRTFLRLGGFYNRKERGFSSFDQLLAQVFAGLLALTAAAIWPKLLSPGPLIYLLLAALFTYYPISARLRHLAAGSTKPFNVRQQKLSQLAAACLFLAGGSALPAIRSVSFYLLVTLTLTFALRPVYLLYLKNETRRTRLVGLGLLTTYTVVSVALYSLMHG